MCSSGYVFPVNMVKVGTFTPTGMAALLILGEKGDKPASSVWVPLHICPATLSVRGSICFCNEAILPPSHEHFPPHLVSEPPDERDALLRGRRSSLPGEQVRSIGRRKQRKEARVSSSVLARGTFKWVIHIQRMLRSLNESAILKKYVASFGTVCGDPKNPLCEVVASGQQQPHTSAPHPDYQHAPLAPEVEAIFQQRLPKERAAWEQERGSQEYPSSRHETQYSHESDESPAMPEDEVNNTSTILEKRKNKSAAPSQVPAPQVDPAVVALQQQLNDLKKLMASVIQTGSIPSATMTKIPFTDMLDSVALPSGFKLP
ncbi:hypothetical protein LIER_37807 [Lithospermum erythrorhizon]|uniref:Uncharacterized protein n=1 Tax=Lithospermum erythrorhizon TaxID=34254 RepID=A0AAV3PQV3_LITER